MLMLFCQICVKLFQNVVLKDFSFRNERHCNFVIYKLIHSFMLMLSFVAQGRLSSTLVRLETCICKCIGAIVRDLKVTSCLQCLANPLGKQVDLYSCHLKKWGR